MPIEKELWVDIIKEQPIQEGDFLNESEDLSALVDNNTLHLAEAGVEPEVFLQLVPVAGRRVHARPGDDW